MQLPIYILAAPDVTEILFGVVFFLIWIASAAMSQMAKQREKQRRERVRREIESGGKAPQPVLSQPRQQQPQPIRRTPAPRPVQARPVARRPAPAPKRPAPQRVPTPVEVMMSQTPPPPPPVEIKAQPAAATPARRPQAATATSLNAWLKPATLRQQFILTELLQPPLALRDPDSSRLI